MIILRLFSKTKEEKSEARKKGEAIGLIISVPKAAVKSASGIIAIEKDMLPEAIKKHGKRAIEWTRELAKTPEEAARAEEVVELLKEKGNRAIKVLKNKHVKRARKAGIVGLSALGVLVSRKIAGKIAEKIAEKKKEKDFSVLGDIFKSVAKKNPGTKKIKEKTIEGTQKQLLGFLKYNPEQVIPRSEAIKRAYESRARKIASQTGRSYNSVLAEIKTI